MSAVLADRLADALAGTVLAARLSEAAASFLELRGGDTAAARLDGPLLRGLARTLVSQPEAAGFLSHRPVWLERLAHSTPDSLEARRRELASQASEPADDLEAALDALRLLRREETCFAACHDLGGGRPFEEVSGFLSVLAETITRHALELARHSVARRTPAPPFAVLGMGKLAGREFTYHSDLDLIFLYLGGVDAVEGASRVGQRLISYLTTMTGAGIAYAVDMRLRPSGRQGTLVVGFESFERYQRQEAQTWEHLAILRSRAIAGSLEEATALLERVRAHAASRGRECWRELAELRTRVESERAAALPGIPIKTGAGGLMDVDFLAGGAVLEGAAEAIPSLPSDAGLLRAAVQGKRVERVLAGYHLLRVVEARARWLAGRPLESLDADGQELDVIAELTSPGSDGPALLEQIADARNEIRDAWSDVLDRESIRALREG